MNQPIPNRTIVMAYHMIGGTAQAPRFESLNAVFVVEHPGDEPDWDLVQQRAEETFVFWDMIEAITPCANPDQPIGPDQPRGYGASALQILHPRWAAVA